jgi:mannose-1-phosphate guanylyltransferase
MLDASDAAGRRWIMPRWVIVLAGGQGRRVGHLTRGADGSVVPKQYWHFGTGASLLRRTLDRGRSLVPLERVVPVVDERHRRWWEVELEALPTGNVVVQSRDSGTALGVLGALVRVVLSAPRAVVLVLPSDHHVEGEAALHGSLVRALDEARRTPGRIVLLGITPEGPDTEYGWIVPASRGPRRPGHASPPLEVGSFVEKPDRTQAVRLMSQGALWSSFIFAARANTLLEVFRSVQPGLLRGYLERARAAQWDPAVPLDLVGLPALDFSRDLLERCADRLRILVAPPCGWTDLGTPARIDAWEERRRGLPVPV